MQHFLLSIHTKPYNYTLLNNNNYSNKDIDSYREEDHNNYYNLMTSSTSAHIDPLLHPRTITHPLIDPNADLEVADNNNINEPEHHYTLYPQRFLILFTFSLLSFNQSMFWLTFSPIQPDAEAYYNMDDFTCNWLLNWGPIIYLPCLPLTFYICTIKGGLRKTVLCSSTMCSVAMILRVIPNWLWNSDSSAFANNAVYFLHAGHIINAAAGPLVMSTVSQCSCLWFGINERARATAVAIFANNLGSGVGFLLMPALVNGPNDMPWVLYTHVAFAIFASILTVSYFPEHPPSPPSHAAELIITPPAHEEDHFFLVEMKKVMIHFWNCASHPSFLLLSLSGGILNGVFNSWSALFDSILSPQFNQVQAGQLGFAATIAAIIGGLVMSAIADTQSYNHRMKYLLIIAAFLTLDTYLWFIASVDTPIFTPPLLPSTPGTLGLAIILSGFTLGLSNPLYYELGAELTYPESEAYSAGVLTFYNNAAGIIFIFIQPFFSSGIMNLIMLLTVIGCTLLLFPVKEVYKRRAEDERVSMEKMESKGNQVNNEKYNISTDNNNVIGVKGYIPPNNINVYTNGMNGHTNGYKDNKQKKVSVKNKLNLTEDI